MCELARLLLLKHVYSPSNPDNPILLVFIVSVGQSRFQLIMLLMSHCWCFCNLVPGRLGLSQEHGDDYAYLANPPSDYNYETPEGDVAPLLASYLLKVTIFAC